MNEAKVFRSDIKEDLALSKWLKSQIDFFACILDFWTSGILHCKYWQESYWQQSLSGLEHLVQLPGMYLSGHLGPHTIAHVHIVTWKYLIYKKTFAQSLSLQLLRFGIEGLCFLFCFLNSGTQGNFGVARRIGHPEYRKFYKIVPILHLFQGVS